MAMFHQLPPKEQQEQRKPTHNHGSGKKKVHGSMRFRSGNPSTTPPESKQDITVVPLVESTVEKVDP